MTYCQSTASRHVQRFANEAPQPTAWCRAVKQSVRSQQTSRHAPCTCARMQLSPDTEFSTDDIPRNVSVCFAQPAPRAYALMSVSHESQGLPDNAHLLLINWHNLMQQTQNIFMCAERCCLSASQDLLGWAAQSTCCPPARGPDETCCNKRK